MNTKQEQTAPPNVIVRTVIQADAERVFDAWTRPELLVKWFFRKSDGVQVTNELIVGGNYSIVLLKDGDSAQHLHEGKYLEIRRAEKLVFTWNTSMVQNTRVSVNFRNLGEATEVIITHELLPTEELRNGHAEGWKSLMENISNYFS